MDTVAFALVQNSVWRF